MIPAKLATAMTLALLAFVASPMSATPLVSEDGPVLDAASARVEMFDFGYADDNGLPVTVIATGDAVTFVNVGAAPHTATDTLGSFDTGTVTSGGSRSIGFSEPGVFVYECIFHPTMRGVLVVA